MEYYFASKINFNNETLYPKIPKSRMNTEDSKISRICVSQSINGCLTAIEPKSVGEVLYIHKCISDNTYQPTLAQVPDRHLTGEIWILEPVEMKLFMKIVTTGCIDNEFNTMHNAQYNFKIIDFD